MIGQVGAVVGSPVLFTGYAGDYDKAICGVQYSLDNGRTWTTYDTPGTTAERNLYWQFSYTPQVAGRYQLLIRSINEDGQVSPTPARVDFVAVESETEPTSPLSTSRSCPVKVDRLAGLGRLSQDVRELVKAG